MPWSSKQHRLFEAAAHSPTVAAKVGIPVAQAQKMASEGVKLNKPMSDMQRKSAAQILRRK